jgi:hypothetical protein
MVLSLPHPRRPLRANASKLSRASFAESLTAPIVALLLVLVSLVAVQGYLRHASIDAAAGRFGAGDYADLLSDRGNGPLATDWRSAWLPTPTMAAMSERARAVRVGARVIDLELSARARNGAIAAAYYRGDPAATAVFTRQSPLIAAFAGEITATLADVPEAAASAGLYARVVGMAHRPATINSELYYGRKALLDFQPRYLAIGNWLEAARVAAQRGDRAFFNTPESRAALLVLASTTTIPPDARPLVDRLLRLMPDGRAGNLAVLEPALTGALRALAE